MKKPSGLVRDDSKRPDGLTVVPWQSGKPLTWDVTLVPTLADSCVSQTSRKSAKYADLLQSHLFQPIIAETSDSVDSSTATSFTDLGRKISLVSGEVREASFLFQRISVFVKRFNSVHDSFAPSNGFED